MKQNLKKILFSIKTDRWIADRLQEANKNYNHCFIGIQGTKGKTNRNPSLFLSHIFNSIAIAPYSLHAFVIIILN